MNAALLYVYVGTVTTIAGGGFGYKDGPGAEAQFRVPSDIALYVDPLSGKQRLVVVDAFNDMLRWLEPKTGAVKRSSIISSLLKL